MNRSLSLNSNIGFNSPSTVAWVVPDRYLSDDSDIKAGVNNVATILKTTGNFSSPQVSNYECKTIFTFKSANRLSVDDLLELASLLPLQLNLQPQEAQQHEDDLNKIWFALKWTGASDHEDGKFDCKILFHLGQWMLKICHKDEMRIGTMPAFAKKEWLIRL